MAAVCMLSRAWYSVPTHHTSRNMATSSGMTSAVSIMAWPFGLMWMRSFSTAPHRSQANLEPRFRGSNTCGRWGSCCATSRGVVDRVADVVEHLGHDRPEEDERHDHDHGDESEQQAVLNERLAAWVTHESLLSDGDDEQDL